MNKFMIFLAGATCGATVSYFVLKDKFAKQNEKEIEYVREQFDKMIEEERKLNGGNAEDKKTAETIIKDNGYSADDGAKTSDPADLENSERKPHEHKGDEPFIIKPEDFGSGNYEIESLVYYAKNEKLVYVTGSGVDVIDDLFPSEFLNRFGEYEEDMLYVRNPKEGIDYDIEYVDEEYKG